MLSSKPSKQRKLRALLAVKSPSKLMAAHLSKELREKYGRRSVPVRVGDTVKVLRGEYRGITAKVIRVDRRRQFVYLENVTRKKADGTNVNVPVHVSNVMLVSLDLGDEYRRKLLEEGRDALRAWKGEEG
ncbi:MAG: 50S ribosomal protein L24 [Thaumarchaeota archaeon]|nr:50S ribosomal protein L24 [Candidatus Calditenuaceae archaeon]MCX8203806.1 50S ribosomal protein L24 [Nitrososphaeria archaeon]MDW8043090.1 50S ribosomal protein L24 [Nitrososphaerota archaeon]